MSDERTELLGMLAEQRANLRITAKDLDDTQARERTTVSELTVGSVIKHVNLMERSWIDFLVDRYDHAEELPEPIDWTDPALTEAYQMRDGETLAGLLEEYEATARRTEEVVRGLPDLDKRYRTHETPWDPPGKTWSIRQLLLWVLRETAHHSGHADIIRESLDGAKTMSF